MLCVCMFACMHVCAVFMYVCMYDLFWSDDLQSIIDLMIHSIPQPVSKSLISVSATVSVIQLLLRTV